MYAKLKILVTAVGFMSTIGMYGNGPIVLDKITAPITLDGIIEDVEWATIEPVLMTMQLPSFEGAMTEQTEIRLAYDQQYIYLSGVLRDSDPDKIMSNTKKRDALTGSTDWFGCVIDSYNDNQNGLGFFTTPTGLRMDASVQNDANGQLPINISWNNFWDTETTRDEHGWYVEMRIPFTTLPFQVNDGKITMGITVWRFIARKSELHIFPAIPPDYGDWSAWKPSLTQDFVLEGVDQSRPFYVTPYVIMGGSETNGLNDEETQYIYDRDPEFEVGLDVKYGISNNWTLDLSANTDFAQVEADDAQINLTRFSLFFPEKRLFFQERSGVLEYNFGRTDKLFHSRRIGIDNDGNPVRILGGARIIGRTGPWDIGFLNMQTQKSSDINSENFTVFRAKKQIVNDQSTAGLIVTNRMDFKGNYNTTYGLDVSIKVSDKREDYLSVRVAQTMANGNDNSILSADPSRFWISMSRRSQKGFTYGTSLSRAGKDFDPGIGFEARDDYTRFGNRLQYMWFSNEASKIFKHGMFSGGVIHWSNQTDKLESLGWRIGYQLNLKNTWGFSLGVRPRIELITEEFELSDDAVIAPGRYKFVSVTGEFNTPYSKRVFLIASGDIGNFYDGTKTTLNLTPTYSVSPSVEFTGTYQYNLVRFEDRDQEFKVHLVRVKALVMLSTKFSVAAFLQYNSLDKNYLGNIRLRYNPREGNDLYIVFNENLNTSRDREIPFLPLSNARTLLLKYSYTFRA